MTAKPAKDPLLRTLRRFETELHGSEVRRDPSRVRQLLHPSFEEVGHSGRMYTRDDVLMLFTDKPSVRCELHGRAL